MKRLVADPGAIDAVLADGAERARAIAEPNFRVVKEIMGFVQR
jgi:tryptophanyl-tRNA synthetase